MTDLPNLTPGSKIDGAPIGPVVSQLPNGEVWEVVDGSKSEFVVIRGDGGRAHCTFGCNPFCKHVQTVMAERTGF